jgi:DNA sulfur modification protein DndD
MKLLGVKIENFRLLKDFKMKFASESKKNLTVVRAANETGKTTLLYALQWAIFGDISLPKKGVGFRLSSLDQSGEVEISVTIDFSLTNARGIETSYIITRTSFETINGTSWNRDKKSRIVLYKRSDSGIDEIEHAQGWLKPHLPEELREVFFTDGDRALSFIEGTDTDQSQKVEGAIRSLLGLEIIENAISHTRKIKTDLDKKVTDGLTKNKGLNKTNETIQKLNEKIPNDEEEEKDLQKKIEANEDAFKDVDKKLGRALALGDKSKLYENLKKTNQLKKVAIDTYNKATKDQSNLFKTKSLGTGLLKKDIYGANVILQKLYDDGVIPNNAIPILQDRLKGTKCFCGSDIDANTHEGSIRRKNLDALIAKSKKESPVNQRATELFYRTQSLINHWNPKEFTEMFSDFMIERDNANGSRIDAGEQEASIEAEIEQIPDMDIAGLQKRKTDYRNNINTLRFELGGLKNRIEVNKKNLKELEDDQEKLLLGNVKGRQLVSELTVCQDLLKLFGSSLNEMKNDELQKVSNLMNTIFLRMIGSDETASSTTIIKKAEITSAFRIIVHGASNNILNPSQDLNGASRRALTIAFIMALTKISEVVAPNVIDTPLGMTSGYVKNSILKLACQNSSQLIMFLTHDEIRGCEDLIDEYAGEITTITNPAHYPKILVHKPEADDIRVVQCGCNHRESCNVCERRNNEEVDL